MSMIQQQEQFAKLSAEFLVWCSQQGYGYRYGDAWRSTDKLFVPVGDEGFDDDDAYSYQELLFYNRKTKVTYGKHNDRLALDLIFSKDRVSLTSEGYRPLGEKWESMGGKWGGRFGVKPEDYTTKIGWDSNHFEM